MKIPTATVRVRCAAITAQSVAGNIFTWVRYCGIQSKRRTGLGTGHWALGTFNGHCYFPISYTLKEESKYLMLPLTEFSKLRIHIMTHVNDQ